MAERSRVREVLAVASGEKEIVCDGEGVTEAVGFLDGVSVKLGVLDIVGDALSVDDLGYVKEDVLEHVREPDTVSDSSFVRLADDVASTVGECVGLGVSVSVNCGDGECVGVALREYVIVSASEAVSDSLRVLLGDGVFVSVRSTVGVSENVGLGVGDSDAVGSAEDDFVVEDMMLRLTVEVRRYVKLLDSVLVGVGLLVALGVPNVFVLEGETVSDETIVGDSLLVGAEENVELSLEEAVADLLGVFVWDSEDVDD